MGDELTQAGDLTNTLATPTQNLPAAPMSEAMNEFTSLKNLMDMTTRAAYDKKPSITDVLNTFKQKIDGQGTVTPSMAQNIIGSETQRRVSSVSDMYRNVMRTVQTMEQIRYDQINRGQALLMDFGQMGLKISGEEYEQIVQGIIPTTTLDKMANLPEQEMVASLAARYPGAGINLDMGWSQASDLVGNIEDKNQIQTLMANYPQAGISYNDNYEDAIGKISGSIADLENQDLIQRLTLTNPRANINLKTDNLASALGKVGQFELGEEERLEGKDEEARQQEIELNNKQAVKQLMANYAQAGINQNDSYDTAVKKAGDWENQEYDKAIAQSQKENVTELALNNPRAGIVPSDSYEQAIEKSSNYEKQEIQNDKEENFASQGLKYIPSMEEYQSLVKEYGITSANESMYFYTDPLNNRKYFKQGAQPIEKTTSTPTITQLSPEESMHAQLGQVVGSDGFISPDDYLTARNAWIAKGLSPTTFDTRFKGYRNPNNPNYITNKQSTSEPTTPIDNPYE